MKQSVIEDIKKAARDQSTIIIYYINASGQDSQREVEPYEIKNEGLFAHCYSRDNIRFFKLSQIQDTMVTGKRFSPRWPIKIQ